MASILDLDRPTLILIVRHLCDTDDCVHLGAVSRVFRAIYIDRLNLGLSMWKETYQGDWRPIVSEYGMLIPTYVMRKPLVDYGYRWMTDSFLMGQGEIGRAHV